MTGPAGGVFGDVGIGPNGKLSLTGTQFITGKVILAAGATFSNSTHASPGGGVQTNADLSMAIMDATNASANLASLMCDQTIGTLSGTQTITATHSGLNVICVTNVVLNGGAVVTLSNGAFAGVEFLLNVTGKFVNNGGKIVAGGSVQPSDVLYNILGTGAAVAFTGGGGSAGSCCNASVDGTLLAVNRKINLSPGLVRGGAVISALDISIVSGSKVTCPLFCPTS